jgi:hypothetical protein
MDFETPMPPDTMIDPVLDEVDSVELLEEMVPITTSDEPMVALFDMPMPPLNVTLPVDTETDSVLLLTVTIPT